MLSNEEVGAPITVEMLALDRTGSPHVALNAQVGGSRGLFYASRDAQGWYREEIPLGDSTSPDGGTIALALYPDGDPYVVATVNTRHSWKHIWVTWVTGIVSARRVGATWTQTRVSTETAEPALAIAPDDVAYLASATNGQTTSRDWTDPSIGWGTVDEWPHKVLALAMSLDDQGKPHFSEVVDEIDLPDTLRYIQDSGERWAEEVVDRASDVGKASAIAIDPKSNPAVSYHDAKEGAVELAHWSGTAWTSEKIEYGIQESSSTSLKFATDGAPWVAYMKESLAGPQLGLEVAMDDAARLRVREPGEHALDHADDLRERQPARRRAAATRAGRTPSRCTACPRTRSTRAR